MEYNVTNILDVGLNVKKEILTMDNKTDNKEKIYVSQELDISGIDENVYMKPIKATEEIFCTLDARCWINRSNNDTILCLFVTTKDNIKLKFFVFLNKKNRLYTPSSAKYSTFCCKDNLALNDKLRIYYSKSSKSDFIYIREIDIIN